MKKLVKQVAGIDVAQHELVVCMGRMHDDWSPQLYAHKTFANTPMGFAALQKWVTQVGSKELDVRYVMEATGVYHERLAYYLAGKGCMISVVLPNKISNYFRTLEVKTITDKTAAEAIACFGLERKLNNWKRPAKAYRELRQLTRERDQLVQERTMIMNQLHAEQSEAEPGESSILRMKKRIALLNKQEQQIKDEIQAMAKQDEHVNSAIKTICTIPGIGVLTAATVVGETNGFELILNKRQLTSYAGLDVKEKQSGTSVKGKPRISKKGNKYLRKAMYMPALTAIRHDQRHKAIFDRLVARHGIKMKAIVAVQRKMLEMIYTIYKTKTAYDPAFLQKKVESNY